MIDYRLLFMLALGAVIIGDTVSGLLFIWIFGREDEERNAGKN